MTDDDDFATRREEFKAQVRAMEAIAAENDVDGKKYNTLVDKLDSQVNEWAERGIVKPILSLLLTDDSPRMRGAAASYLLRTSENQQAIDVLAELADNSAYGEASRLAWAALRIWRKQHP